MAFNREGITTGLMGYTLKKELFGDAVFYRETQVFNYEIYSSDVSGLHPSVIQDAIYNEFITKYSGDIFVKVFNAPADYQFPNDSIRTAKFNVQVEIVNTPSGIGSSELTGVYYKGIDPTFFEAYITSVNDFRDDFSFEQTDNGHQVYSHNVSFSLRSGDKSLAQSVISGIFAADKDTTFGITAMAGGVIVADTGNYQNYYTESYDLAKNIFSFTKKREILPFNATTFNYDLEHSLSLHDNGVFDISERCSVQGKLSFEQARVGLDSVYVSSYNRCTAFYDIYKNFAGNILVAEVLSTTPVRLSKTYNKPNLMAEYDVAYTNNPEFKNDGSSTEEVIELELSPKQIIDINHRFSTTFNRRNPDFNGVMPLINNFISGSQSSINNYYVNSEFYNPSWPMNRIKYTTQWPNIHNHASVNLNYTNDPKYFVTLNGILFNVLDYKVQNVKPVDIVTEYKVINRPNKTSIINYAYQTEKGQVSVNITAGIGRMSNEFISGFRDDMVGFLSPLYKYGIARFMEQFGNIIPIAFTYFLSDIKYSLNSDGTLQMVLDFNYTLKKYII